MNAQAIPLRIYHIDLNLERYRFRFYLSLLDRIAAWGYNAVMIQYGDMFPYKTHPSIPNPDHWTPSQIGRFCRAAESRSLDIIPMVQSFGHLGIMLRNPGYFELCEDPTQQGGVVESICPLNPRAVEVVRGMHREMIAAHPGSRLICLGGDEALMGVCPACRRHVEHVGLGRHYADHMQPSLEIVLAAGKRPIIWADMVERHQDALAHIDRRTILGDWGYYVRSLHWHTAVAKGNDTSYRVTPHSLGRLPLALRRRYEPYWSYGVQEYPRKFHGFPYIRYLMDKGFDVIFCASMKCSGDSATSVRYDLHLDNCLAAAEAVAEAGALGIMTCHFAAKMTPHENQFLGAAVAAQAYLRPGRTDPERAAATYERKTFGKACGLLDIYRKLGELTGFCNTNFFGDYDGYRMVPKSIPEQMKLAQGDPELALMRTDQAESWIRRSGIDHREIDVLHYSINELAYKARLVQAYEQWRGNEKSVDWRTVHHEMIRVRRLFERTFRTTYPPWTLAMARDFRFAADETWIRQRLDAPRQRKTKK